MRIRLWMQGVLLAGVVLLLSVLPVSAQLAGQVGDVVETFGTNGGAVDWTTGVVTATGLGAPPPNLTNPAQARAMAERAAHVGAQRNLLEVVKGVQMDSATLVENLVTTSDVIKAEVKGLIQGARVMKKQMNPDGSIEITVGVKLTGELANTLLPPHTGGGVPVVPSVSAAPAPGPSTTAPPTQAPAAASAVFTGLIVDARGLGLKPAMVPKIRNEEGREVYGSAFVDRKYAVEQGMVGYLKDISAAQSNSRVTDHPLVVKALKTDGPNKTDLVISNSDAQTLHGMKENLSFLEKARVTDNPLIVKGVRASGAKATDVVLGGADVRTILKDGVVAPYLRQGRVVLVYD